MEFQVKDIDSVEEPCNSGSITEVESSTKEKESELPLNVNPGESNVTIEHTNAIKAKRVKEVDKISMKPPPKKRKIIKPVNIDQKGGSKAVSEIWDHFTRIEESEPPRAPCNYCAKSYAAHPRDNGTTSLWTHLEKNCKKYPYRLDKAQKTLHDFKHLSENLKAKTLSYEELRELLAKMIIIDGLPFRFVEGAGFRDFVKGLDPKFEVPSRYTVARDCLKIFAEERKKLKKILRGQRVCLTTDTWTSLQNLNYMCVTAHWISFDWKLEKRIISFCIIENHKGETIAKHLEECLLDWDIDKILTITVDNASSNDKAINTLKRKCKWKDAILNNDCMHVRCSAHVVNLIVKEGLEEQNDVIVRVRNAVKYVRSSPARLNAFKKCVMKEKIDSKSLVCLDVETRWNSTYLITKGDYTFASMAFQMKLKFNKYWGNIDSINMLLFVAIVLDPRFKLKYVNFCLSSMFDGNATLVKKTTDKVEESLKLLYTHYDVSDSEQTNKEEQERLQPNNMQIDGDDDLSKLLESQFAMHLEKEQCVESKSEITRYLLEGCEKSDNNFDILSWWKVNTPKYPVLSKIARDVLAIPVSTIASESAFSTSGRVIDPFRSSLSPKTVEALICAQDWLRETPSSIDLQSIMEDIEQFEEIENEMES